MRTHVVLGVMLAAGLVSSEVSQETKDAIDARLDSLESTLYTIARQIMLQRLALEEKLRSDGDSGVKQIRVSRDGTKAYYTNTHTGGSAAAIHNHAELLGTCGMGELDVVLNGAHFRTRHNDYKLVRPSTTTKDYHDREQVEYPPVPPEVLNQTDLNLAFRTLRSYFRAWLNGNDTEYNYKPYFRPVLCYLEGAWTTDSKVDEPFISDRHHLDARSWFDLQEKARYTAYTGEKDVAENYAYLPTTIVNVSDGQPVLAQWNYRILCHPIEGDDLELQHLKPVDDLHSRLASHSDMEGWLASRKARFQITTKNRDISVGRGTKLLDKIMAQIPGKDNYLADIRDNNLGNEKFDIHDGTKPLNAGFYHRWFELANKDAMGVQVNKRAFADRYLFVAHNTQPRVVPMSLTACDHRGENCVNSFARVSYAVPLEVIWTSPLNSWNPYQLEYKGPLGSPLGKTVKADGRNGGLTVDTAYNGTSSGLYALTPVQFFKGGELEVDAADTTPGGIGVLDPWNNVREVVASGLRIHLPPILDVGNVRQRYPIFPVHAEGSKKYKDLEALSKIVMDLQANVRLLHAIPQFGSNATEEEITPDKNTLFFKMMTGPSNSTKGTHVHYVDLRSKYALYAMDGCETYQVRTSISKRHTHLMTVHYNSDTKQFEYLECDGRLTCRDNHAIELTPVKS